MAQAFVFDTDLKSFDKFKTQLGLISRARFPIAVRNTLNSAAIDTKRGLQKQALKKFEDRKSRTFFNAFSKAELVPTRQLNVKLMTSKAGMTERNRAGKKADAAKNMGVQQTGGNLSRPFIPFDEARKGRKRSGKVERKHSF